MAVEVPLYRPEPAERERRSFLSPPQRVGADEVASAGVNSRRPGLDAAPDEAGPAEQQRIGVQGLQHLWAVDGREVGDPGGQRLGLDVDVGVAAVAGLADPGDLLALGDPLTDVDTRRLNPMISGKVSTRTPIGRRLRPRPAYQSATTTRTVRDRIRFRRVSRNASGRVSVGASVIARSAGDRPRSRAVQVPRTWP